MIKACYIRYQNIIIYIFRTYVIGTLPNISDIHVFQAFLWLSLELNRNGITSNIQILESESINHDYEKDRIPHTWTTTKTLPFTLSASTSGWVKLPTLSILPIPGCPSGLPPVYESPNASRRRVPIVGFRIRSATMVRSVLNPRTWISTTQKFYACL
jgi:hypothetical protein